MEPPVPVHSPSVDAPSRLRHVPGLLLCLVLAVAAASLGRQAWFANRGLSALTLAIMLGMALGNLVPARWISGADLGIGFSKQVLLRTGIVLYGVKLTLQDIGRVGVAGVLIDTLVLSSTFTIAWLVGTRVLKMDRQLTLLLGAGSSICGAAAVLATQPVVEADSGKVAVAVSTVVIFGTLAIFLYPALYHLGLLNWLLPGGMHSFGVYEGSTIHEVAQVLAAAHGLGGPASDAAVIAKMVRVMMLAPFLIGLSAWMVRTRGTAKGASSNGRTRLAIPWFAFIFVGVVIVNSLVSWTPSAIATVNDIDLLMLGMAMAALGLTTQVSAIQTAGFRPLILGAFLWAWLVVGGAVINGLVTRLM